MARSTESLDVVLRRLRTLPPLKSEHITYQPETSRAHAALGRALADWVDAVRIDPSGSYEAALVSLDVMVNVLPAAPELQVSDFVEINALGPDQKAIEQ